jgi:hypothetical protein
LVAGEENCRSLGFARDDRKERVVVRKGRLLKDRVVVGAGETHSSPFL